MAATWPSVRLVGLIGIYKTGCCRETRLVLHVYLAHHELESIYIVVVVVDIAICVQSAGWCCVFLTSTSQVACQA